MKAIGAHSNSSVFFVVTCVFSACSGALVHVYADGSVQISVGGTEMGQGLFTKMAQIAAAEFGIDLSSVHIAETGTDKV